MKAGWLYCLKKLSILAKRPTWSTYVPEVEIPDPPKPYLPILLLDFNEEYANQLAKDKAKGGSEVKNSKAANKIGEEVKTNGAREGD